jgi:hypothetical protein
MKSPTPIEVWSLRNDRNYFARLWREIRSSCRQSLTIIVGLTCLSAVTLVYLEAKLIDAKIWGVCFVVVVVVMTIFLRPQVSFDGFWQDTKKNCEQNLVVLVGLICLLAVTLSHLQLRMPGVTVWAVSVTVITIITLVMAIRLRRPKHRKVARHQFDPVSLGTLWFSFAVTLWVSQPIREWDTILIEIYLLLGVSTFLVAVFSRSTRVFLNTEAVPHVMFLTLIAFVSGFILGWVPALSHVSEPIRGVILYFGFLWIIVMLMVMIRDVRYEVARIVFVAFFFIAGLVKLGKHDIVGGLTLVVIAALLYLVATDRTHPYGEVAE